MDNTCHRAAHNLCRFSDMLSGIADNLSGGGISDKDAMEFFKNKKMGDDKNV